MRNTLLLIIFLSLMCGLSFAQDVTPYEIALERIHDAAQTSSTSLYLGNLDLEDVPPDIAAPPL